MALESSGPVRAAPNGSSGGFIPNKPPGLKNRYPGGTQGTTEPGSGTELPLGELGSWD